MSLKISTELTMKLRINPNLLPQVGIVHNIDRNSILLSNPEIEYLGKKEFKDGEMKFGQSAILRFGSVFPKDNKVAITINPALSSMGLIISYPTCLLPGVVEQPVQLIAHAIKNVVIPKDMWIVGLYAAE